MKEETEGRQNGRRRNNEGSGRRVRDVMEGEKEKKEV